MIITPETISSIPYMSADDLHVLAKNTATSINANKNKGTAKFRTTFNTRMALYLGNSGYRTKRLMDREITATILESDSVINREAVYTAVKTLCLLRNELSGNPK